MSRPWIRCIDEDEADGELADIYRAWLAANPGRTEMPSILKCFSARPDVLKPLLELTYPLQFADGAVSRRTKEMLATYVSGLNHCDY